MDMTHSQKITEVRRIGSVRKTRLEATLADALRTLDAAQRRLNACDKAIERMTIQEQDARLTARKDPASQPAQLWLEICALRRTEAVEARAIALEVVQEAEGIREAAAQALMRHISRDTALADHGKKMQRAENRIAEIRGEEFDVAPHNQRLFI
jgi:hypothetical protein